MFTRVTRVQNPPEAVEAGIAFFKDKVVPMAKAAPGNAGVILLVDRKTGTGMGITVWATAQALGASEQMGIASRTQSVAATGGSIVNVERGEQVIMERAQPPLVGSFVRLNTIAGDPKKIDKAIKFVENQVVPALKALKGFRALIMNVDRMTGRSTVSTVWTTQADLEASEPKIASLRRDAADAAGASDVKVEIFETAFSEITQPARV